MARTKSKTSKRKLSTERKTPEKLPKGSKKKKLAKKTKSKAVVEVCSASRQRSLSPQPSTSRQLSSSPVHNSVSNAVGAVGSAASKSLTSAQQKKSRLRDVARL